MISKERAIINTHRLKIIEDLHDDVTFRVYRNNTLTSKEYDDIKILTTKEARNEKLLDILLEKCNGFEQLKIETKDWYPWIYNLLNDTDNVADDEYSLAIEGGVPPIPVHNVTRRSLLENVRRHLRLLKRGHYLVLKGMIGCGKSCLAAESLNKSLIQECFKGKVYWLSAGSATDDVWGLQAELYERIFTDELNIDVKRAQAQLKNRFNSPEYKDSLLVLDDVASESVIDALEISCKILVTTNDVGVMKKHEGVSTFIKVEEGFTEKETLQLLAQCVSINVDKLPLQAKVIYAQSKGYPMIVSLIGAQLSDHKEEVTEVKKSWDLYVQSLNNKDMGNIKRRSLTRIQGLKPTLDLCISKLEEQLQEYYKDFALFLEDVNIKPEVLEILWSLSEYRLKNEVMAEFVRKSLVIRKWNQKLNSYVYGIHDLLLEYLRSLLNKEESRALHEKLIRCYEKKCDGDFSKLPQNDNYIFYYLGYHLNEAQMFTMFPKLYFNLEFIEAKLRVVGPADLLSDYRKYKEHITDKLAPHYVNKLRDFQWFIEWAGQSIRRMKDVDIVQFALQEHKNSYVFKEAMKLAHKRQRNKYIQFPFGAPDSRVAPNIIQYREHITAACFSDIKTNIIIAEESGHIQILDFRGLVLRTFEGHEKKITHLAVSKNDKFFLSTSEDSTIKVWKLVDSDSPLNGIYSNGYGNRTPSPRQRQVSYSELWNVDRTGETSLCDLSCNKGTIVVCAEFSPDSTKIVAASSDKIITVWDLSLKSVIVTIRLPSEPTACIFSNCGNIIFCSGKDCKVMAYNAILPILLASFTSSYPVKSLYAITRDGETELIVLTNSSVCSHGIHEAGKVVDEKLSLFKDYSRKNYEKYLCCGVPQDGSYIAVAVSNHKILLCEPQGGQVIREIHEPSGNPICLTADSRSNYLLGIYPDQIIRLWKVEITFGELPTSLKSNFHSVWPNVEGYPTIAAPTNRHSVKVLYGRQVMKTYVFDNREVLSCALTQDGTTIICGCDDGTVWQCVNEEKTLTMRLSSTVYSVRGYELSDDDLVIIAVSNHSQMKIWIKGLVKEIVLGSRDCVNFFFLPSSYQLLTACRDSSIKRWTIGSNGQCDQMEIINQLRLDGELIACVLSCKQILAVVDRKRLLLQTLRPTSSSDFFSLQSPPITCNFSPNGATLAIGLFNGTVQIFAMDLMQFIREVEINSGPIQSLCLGNNGVLGVVCQHTVAIIPSSGDQIAQVQLSAKHIDNAPDRDEFVTIDAEGNIHLLTLLNNETENTESRLHLDLNCQ